MTDPGSPSTVAQRHVRFGWWTLLLFLSLGIVLETLHAFKVGLYLQVSNEARRLMWTLAHAHGTLLALIHIAYGVSVQVLGGRVSPLASACLRGASILLPGGFFLGGLVLHGGDPGLGILLIPVGALLLFVGVFLAARGAGRGAG